MCEEACEVLPCDPRSAARARAFVVSACQDWALGTICEDLTLPVSEIVTNAVVHANTDIELSVRLTRRFVEVSVSDHNPRPPIVRPVHLDLTDDTTTTSTMKQVGSDQVRVGHADAGTGGRGLHIVDAVADEWGVEQYQHGKDVWFRIAVTRDEAALAVCPCDQQYRPAASGGRPS